MHCVWEEMPGISSQNQYRKIVPFTSFPQIKKYNELNVSKYIIIIIIAHSIALLPLKDH